MRRIEKGRDGVDAEVQTGGLFGCVKLSEGRGEGRSNAAPTARGHVSRRVLDLLPGRLAHHALPLYRETEYMSVSGVRTAWALPLSASVVYESASHELSMIDRDRQLQWVSSATRCLSPLSFAYSSPQRRSGASVFA